MNNDSRNRRTFNILHTEWSPDGWGGQERRIIQECLRVREMGHKVVIACQPGSALLENATRHGIPVEEVVMRRVIDPKAVWKLYRAIKKHNIDVVSTHSSKDSWSGGIAAKLANVELLVRTRHVANRISQSPFNFVYRMPDGFVTTGEAVREAMIADNGVAADKIVSIATGVSLERFDPARPVNPELRRELGIPEGAPVVTMVALLRREKRHDVLVACAAIVKEEFPQARFLVVGDGAAKGRIEALVREAGLEQQVILTGYRNDVPELLAISDIALLTSQMEGVPQGITQAMAMGLPVVAAPVGGLAELVLEGKTGIRAQSGDPASYARALVTLLRDEPLRRKLGEAAREYVMERYTEEMMARRTLEFYNRLVSAKGRGRR
jgi:glycosyltransferase involved in cell wall biosynthesis